LINHPPLAYPLKATYSTDELTVKFPQGVELLQILGSDITIQVYEHQPKRFYIVEQPNGKKQSLRFVQTERKIDEITKDLENQPSGLPKLRVIQFNDGRIGVLTEWIEGRHPDFNFTDDRDRELCSKASETLVTIPWEIQNPNTPFDLNYTNFKIREEEEDKARAYYVDSDLPEFIVQHGLSNKINAQREKLLKDGKQRNKLLL